MMRTPFLKTPQVGDMNSKSDASTSAAYYDGIALGYESLYKNEQSTKIQHAFSILADLDITLSGKGIDIGCGSGFALSAFAEKYSTHIVGIDPSIELLKLGPTEHTQLGVAEEIPFEDNKFDFCLSFSALQNCYNLTQAIDELKRVVKKDGVLVLSIMTKQNPNADKILNQIKNQFTILHSSEVLNDTLIIARNT